MKIKETSYSYRLVNSFFAPSNDFGLYFCQTVASLFCYISIVAKLVVDLLYVMLYSKLTKGINMKNTYRNFPLIRVILTLIATPIAFLYLPTLVSTLISM